MIPIELKHDKNGLLYTDNVDLIRFGFLDLDKREFENERYYTNEFHSFPSTDQYIIKHSLTGFTRKERKLILEMLSILVSKQKDVRKVDFPIGYTLFKKKLNGLVVPFYRYGISLDRVLNNHDIEELGKYYYHDEDSLHNMFMLLDEILDLLYEMFENDIYYTDINPGNIILDSNKTKLIDFDYRYVHFKNKDYQLSKIMQFFVFLINEMLKSYNLFNGIVGRPEDFEDAKVFIKKVENRIRKG